MLAPADAGSLVYITTVVLLYWLIGYELQNVIHTTVKDYTDFFYGLKWNIGVIFWSSSNICTVSCHFLKLCIGYTPINQHVEKFFCNLPPRKYLHFFFIVYHDEVNFSTSLTPFLQNFSVGGLIFLLFSANVFIPVQMGLWKENFKNRGTKCISYVRW